MAWKSVVGATFTDIADFLTNDTNGLYKTLTTDMGWTLHNKIDTYDQIFKSTGEDGTEVIFVRITGSGSPPTEVIIRIATWYPSSGTPANDSNEVGTSGATSFQLNNSASHIGWIYGDKDYVVITNKQDGYYSTFGFGVIKRLSPTHWSGRTTATNAETMGAGDTVVEVGSTTNFTAGQKVWMINVGDNNKGKGLRCTVKSIDDNNKTLTLTNDYGSSMSFDAGALIALDPMPVCIHGFSYTYGGYYRGCPSHALSFLYDPAETNFQGAAQTTPTHRAGSSAIGQRYNLRYTSQDMYYNTIGPAARGEFVVEPTFIVGHLGSSWLKTTGAEQLRGYNDRICSITYGGTISPEDTLKDGSTSWIVFADPWGTTYFPDYFKRIAVRTVQ